MDIKSSYSKIPSELRSVNNWLVAQIVPDSSRPGKSKKLPRSAKNGLAEGWNLPENLSSFDEAVAFCESQPNHVLGFAFKNSPFIGLDLDDAFGEDAFPKNDALPLLKKYGLGYMERSPSGKGIRLFLKRNGPADGLSQHLEKQPLGNGCSVEVFLGGFCTVTGNQFGSGTGFAEASPTEVWRYCQSLNRSAAQVDEPGRNNVLAKYAGQLAKKYLSVEEAKLLIHAKNKEFAQPLDESELESTIFKSLSKWAKTSDEDPDAWRDECLSFDQLTSELPRHLLEGLVPEKVLTAISAHSFNGKTWSALQIAHAISEARPLWGFKGPEKEVPVIYHVPEMNEAMVKDYMRQLKIRDSENFLVRPMEKGLWPLNSPKMLKSSEGRLVVLDTQGFFNQSDDGNDYQQALKFAEAVFNLLNTGALGVIALFHLAKNISTEWTLQNSIIGSTGYGGILRSCLRMQNLNSDLNDKSMWLYVQGMKNPGLKPFQLQGPPPLELKIRPGDSPYLKDIVPGQKKSAKREKFDKASALFEQGLSQRKVSDQLELSLGKVNTLHQQWKAEKEIPF